MKSPRAPRVAVAAVVLALTVAFLGLRPSSPTSLPLLPVHTTATVGGPEAARFLADARAATSRYDSVQHAIDDGFTRVGTEFPAMGEHWVSFARVMEDTLDARRPSVLIYANTVDGPRLAGVAYSRLLGSGAMPPAFPFVGAWHEHNGAVSEESLPSGHSGHMALRLDVVPLPDDSLRFFILHAWIRNENPDGPFATDNWTLPMLRLGLAPGTRLPHDVIRGLALGADEQDYHHAVLSTAMSLSEQDDSLVADIVRSRRTRLGDEMALIRRDRAVSPHQAVLLEAAWDSLWLDLRRALPSRRTDLERLRVLM
jgi:hypothetical protein